MTVTEILDEARALLNDTGSAIYTDAACLPYIKKAWLELQNKYVALGVPYPKAIVSDLPVAALATTLNASAGFPTDFIQPIQLKEKAQGDPAWAYVPMVEKTWEPDDQQLTTLNNWSFRDGTIYFRGATTNRSVKLYYWKSFAVIASGATVIPYQEAKSVLAGRTAELCARFIGGNATRADSLLSDWVENFELIKSAKVREMQSMPVRRRGWKYTDKLLRRRLVG